MLESMGVPVQVADDGSMSVALTGALDLDRLSENLKGEVKKAKQEQKVQSRIVESHAKRSSAETEATKKLEALKGKEADMKEALAMVARVAEAQKAGESNPEALADLQKSLASLAEDNEDLGCLRSI